MTGAEKLGILAIGVRPDEIGEVLRSLVIKEGFAPFDQIGEIHIRGEILKSLVLVDFMTFDTLLEKVSAQGALWTAMIEVFRKVTVINREHFSTLPAG